MVLGHILGANVLVESLLAATLSFALAGMSGSSLPRQIVEAPPGAKCSLVVGRSVMTLPQFWFAPFANRFAEARSFRTLVALSASSLPRQMVEAPPGAK